MRIALCLCFKDEERNVVSMLHSCYKAIDGVFALNNGSTDRSDALIQYWCMKAGIPCGMMYESEATGAPDRLYNRVFEEAERQGYDWVLMLDADERLAGQCRASLRSLGEVPNVDAYSLSRRTTITPYCPTAGGEIEPYTDSIEYNENHLRFFRAGMVRYPGGDGPHLGARANPEANVRIRPFCPTDITHDRDGCEQLRRDKLRGQYPDQPMPTPSSVTGGWYDYQEIYRRAVEECRDGGTIVELGNYLGRSLLDLGRRVQESGKSIRLVGCDLYRLTPDPFQHTEILSDGCRWLPRISESLIRAGLGDTVSLLQWPSWECAKLFEDGSVDFCFVDACHEEYAVRKDLAAWWPKIRRGGLFGGHDFSPLFPQVCKVAEEFAASHGLPLHVDVSPGSWLVRKP